MVSKGARGTHAILSEFCPPPGEEMLPRTIRLCLVRGAGQERGVQCVDDYFDPSLSEDIQECAESIAMEWSRDRSGEFLAEPYDFGRYIRTDLECQLIAAFKLGLSLEAFNRKNDVTSLELEDLPGSASLVAIALFPELLRPHPGRPVSWGASFLSVVSELLYRLIVVPKNALARILAKGRGSRGTIVLMGGPLKTGKLYRELFRRGFAVLSIGGLVPFWDNGWLGGESLKVQSWGGVAAFPPVPDPKCRVGIVDFGPVVGRILSSYGPCLEQCRKVKRILESRSDIRFVLLSRDCHDYHALARDYALTRGIPSAIFQHGVLANPIGLHGYTGSLVFAWGELAKEWFISHGIEEKSIRVVGCPELREEIGGGGFGKPGVLLALSWSQSAATNVSRNTNVDVLLRSLDVVDRLPGKRLIVKLHPRQSEADLRHYQRLVGRRSARRVEFCRDTPIESVLKRSCACISEKSSVGLEAIGAGRPFIMTNFMKFKRDHVLVNSGEVPLVDTGEGLEVLLRDLLSEKASYEALLERQRVLYRRYVVYGGRRSCAAIADEIERCA